jgi:NAD dependent epimerase/dehydratase family enzyme
MKLLVTGATGLIGKNILAHSQRTQYWCSFLTLSKGKLIHSEGPKRLLLEPERRNRCARCFEGVDTLIHLAGRVFQTLDFQKQKRNFGKQGECTRFVRKALDPAKYKNEKHRLCFSIGIYPNSLDEVYDENSSLAEENFLQKVTSAWKRNPKPCGIIPNIYRC